MRILVVLALLLAGCAVPAHDPGAPLAPVVPAFPQSHDHDESSLHDFGMNLDVVGYHNLVPGDDRSPAAREGWLNSEVVIRGGRAFVAYLGAPWLVGIVDVADPESPALLGALAYANAWGMDVAASDDGAWAFVAVYPDASALTGTPLVDALPRMAQSAPTPGVAVVDARDPTAPKLSSFFPVHGLGPHTLNYHLLPDGREIVVLNKADLNVGNGLLIAQVVETPTGRALEPLSFFALNGPRDPNFPHDVDLQVHPVTGQLLLYAAYWDSGLVILDLADPAKPRLVGQWTDAPADEELQIHDVHPYGALVDGRHYTLTGPEIPTGDASGHLRVFDTTDPTKPVHVSSWIMPGEFVVDEPFVFSAHNFQFLPDSRVAIAHGHAGVWIVDWLDVTGPRALPEATGYRVPVAEGVAPPAWSPVTGAPWVWGTAIGLDGTVWATDVVGGLFAMRAR